MPILPKNRYVLFIMLECYTVGPLCSNAYIIASAAGCVLVDPGDEAPRLLAALRAKGLSPTCVVATHGHLDHTAALYDLYAAWADEGLRPPLAAHVLDAPYFGERGEAMNRELFAALGGAPFFEAYWRPMPDIDLGLEEGAEIPGSGFTVIYSPGHTRGSICLYDAGLGLLISGDTLFRGGVGRSDGPDSDPEELERSLERLSGLPGSTRVFPGHGEPTTIAGEFARPWARP